MSFLNLSHHSTSSRGDLSISRASNVYVIIVDGAFRFTDDISAEDFMELLSRRISDLERDVTSYDET